MRFQSWEILVSPSILCLSFTHTVSSKQLSYIKIFGFFFEFLNQVQNFSAPTHVCMWKMKNIQKILLKTLENLTIEKKFTLMLSFHHLLIQSLTGCLHFAGSKNSSKSLYYIHECDLNSPNFQVIPYHTHTEFLKVFSLAKKGDRAIKYRH